MTNHADLIAALRIPMNVTLPGAPELDEYDEQRKAAADALEAAWADATAAAYGRARNVAGAWGGTTVANLIYNEIASLTPQSARDWLAEREVAIRADERAKAIGEFRESPKFCDICKMEVHALHTHASRAIPIKGKDDG